MIANIAHNLCNAENHKIQSKTGNFMLSWQYDVSDTLCAVGDKRDESARYDNFEKHIKSNYVTIMSNLQERGNVHISKASFCG